MQNLVIQDRCARWRVNLNAIERAMPALTGWPVVYEPSALTARRYDGPALFYRGGASEYVPEEVRGRIQLLFPRATLETMEGAGHWLHAEDPHGFFQTVDAWLAEIDG